MKDDPQRYLFSIEVFDNETEKDIVYASFNTLSKEIIIAELNKAIKKLEK